MVKQPIMGNAAQCSRRQFIGWTVAVAATGPLGLRGAEPLPATRAPGLATASPDSAGERARRADARVAIVRCPTYGPAVHAALQESFRLLGGIGALVRDKTVTIKINLTGTNFSPVFNRPVGESYMTHFDTARALTSLLFAQGAQRVRFVESTNSRGSLETSLGFADWDLPALRALGKVEFENTRNLGTGKRYANLRVADGGRFFNALELNHAYAETDVMVSLCKLKTHLTTGVTLSMKNLFGATPNALYGDEAGKEDAVAGRGPLHAPGQVKLPYVNPGTLSPDPGSRVPRIITDIIAARPIHLAIIDGITTLDGAEGPWCEGHELRVVSPGILIVGLNPVSTDAVGTAVMGFENPRGSRGVTPFDQCENHLLLAERAGLGSADLAQIEVRGEAIQRVRTRFRPPFAAA